jgi:hypothetical protein
MFLPEILAKGQKYKKFVKVNARPAKEGEVVHTYTADGKETSNTAKAGDFVVRNATGAKEEYIISKDKLNKRYKELGLLTGEWKRYQALGECMALRYDGPNMQFKASWDEGMVLKTGDMIVTPLPAKDEVYRIAAKEFKETYK